MKKEKQLSDILNLLEELEIYQKKHLMEFAKKFVPNITDEDILQPNDFSELENNPLFRYEEGVFHGVLSTISAIKATISKD